MTPNSVSPTQSILTLLKNRFTANMVRHPHLDWDKIVAKLEQNHHLIHTLEQMEATGGEPDVISHDSATNEYLFVDCAQESPLGRRNICYDEAALKDRKKYPPKASAESLAISMGAKLLTESEYRLLQTLGEFDTKTSSWLLTPKAIRDLGGAIFADRRYDQVFVYHNGADSYYASRGFRAGIKV